MTITVLRADRLFDGSGAPAVDNATVVIEDQRIAPVGAAGVPDHATVVHLPGATLLPGLVDTHVHLAFDASPDPVGHLASQNEAETLDAMIKAGQSALRGGVPPVRDLGDRDYLSLGLRSRPGMPTIVAAGPPITTPGGHCHYLGGVAEP